VATEEQPEPERRDHDRFERLRAAAIQAEFQTGEREDTVEEARAHILVRLGRITAGFLVVLLGVVMVPLPGPGWLIVLGGLLILSKDFAWAERTVSIVRRRIPSTADGRIAPRTWAVMSVGAVVGIGGSVWWAFLR
jgi:uncharacterized protein (TIGR02611 family)